MDLKDIRDRINHRSTVGNPPRTVALVAAHFPPSTVAGVHRVRHLAKHLPAAGWTPVVICVDEACHEEQLDFGLAALVPAALEVIKVQALPSALCRPLGVGDLSLRAWGTLRAATRDLLQSRPVDAVLITGAPFYSMLMAPRLRREFKVPVVLDFQDPWVSRWGDAQPRLSKAGLSHRLATLAEPRAVRGASFVTSVSQVQNDEMADRYPWLDRRKMAAIPIGGDPSDFEYLRAHAGAPVDALEAGRINLSFVGTFMPRSAPLLRVVFNAFNRLRKSEPGLAGHIRLNFIGTSNQPSDRARDAVRPLADSLGLGESVREIPRRLPYLEALSVLTRAQGILLIGSDEAHYTASKIYPALMSGRPFLSLFHRQSSSHAILGAAGGGLAHAFENEAELQALEGPIAASLRILALSPETLGKADPAAYAEFEAAAVARKFAKILDEAASNAR